VGPYAKDSNDDFVSITASMILMLGQDGGDSGGDEATPPLKMKMVEWIRKVLSRADHSLHWTFWASVSAEKERNIPSLMNDDGTIAQSVTMSLKEVQ